MNEVVGNLIKMLEPTNWGGRVRLDFKSDPELPFVHADPGMSGTGADESGGQRKGDAMPNGGEIVYPNRTGIFR